MPLNLGSTNGILIELCDSDGNPTNVLNPNDFNFLLKPIGFNTFQDGDFDDTILAKIPHCVSDNSPVDLSGASGSDSNHQFCLNTVGFSLGTGLPNDDWFGSSEAPNTFFGVEPNNAQASGRLDGGDCYHFARNFSDDSTNINTWNAQPLPYLFNQNRFTSTESFYPISSYQQGVADWKSLIPIGNNSVSLHSGSINAIESIKISLNLREHLDLLFFEDGINFGASPINASRLHHSGETFEYAASYLNSGWGDYPPLESYNLPSLTVPYDSINGNDILFGFGVCMAWQYNGSLSRLAGTQAGLSNDYQISPNNSAYMLDYLGKVFTFNTEWSAPTYPDPIFAVTDAMVNGSGAVLEQGASANGSVQFNVSSDFTGSVRVLIFDSEDNLEDQTIVDLGVGEVDDLADIGVVDFENENTFGGTLIESVSSNDMVVAPFTYTANETEDINQAIDGFTVYIILETFSGEGLPQGQIDQWQEDFLSMVEDGTNVFVGQQMGYFLINSYYEPVGGCVNPDAWNYNPDADYEDGSCIFEEQISGCTDSDASNYDSDAILDCLGNEIGAEGYVQEEGWNSCCTYSEQPSDYIPDNEALITNPADIVFHLTEQELKYDKATNNDKIIEARENHIEGGVEWKLAFSINKEIDSKKLLQEIAQSTKYVPTFSNDTFSYANVKNTYTGEEEISTVKEEDIIKYNLSRTEIDELYTEVEVQYKYDYGLDNYLESTGKLKINTDYFLWGYGVTMTSGEYPDYEADNPLHKNNYYGLNFDKVDNELKHEDTSLLFKSDYIRDPATARFLAEHLLMWHCNQHNVIELTLPLKYYNLEIGDLIKFDKMIMGKKLYGEKYVLDDPGDMPIRCGQYILPLFMITDVTKTLKNVKLKVIQLHHSTQDNLVWDGETYNVVGTESDALAGDVNGDGFLNVMDIVLMVNIALAQTYLSLADMNSDGAVNIIDVVLLVNTILDVIV